MPEGPLTVKLRCRSWQQLRSIYERDLSRGGFFLRSKRPPAVGTRLRIQLALPSGSTLFVSGEVRTHVPPGGMDGRGPGVDLRLNQIPNTAMWMIESALESAQDSAEPTAPPPPSAEDGDEEIMAASDLCQALRHELESLHRLNPFQVLGVGYDAGTEDVREAFGALSKKYHPDRFARYDSSEVRELSSELFIVLRDAYRQLADPDMRERTLSRLALDSASGSGPGGTPSPQRQRRRRGDGATPVPQATQSAPEATPPPIPENTRPPDTETPPADADVASLRGQEPISLASDGDASAPASQVASPTRRRDLAFSMLDGGDYQRALMMLRVEARKNPDDASCKMGIELAEGLLALASGDRVEAADRFEAVLDLDPSNERAARELAEMRRQAVEQRKGLLSRLMGKKE